MSWLPTVERTEAAGGNAAKTTRVLHLKGGATIDEELAKYDVAKTSDAYRINRVDVKVLPVTNYSSTITVKPDGASQSVVDQGAIAAVSAIYRAGLDALKQKVEGAAG